MLSVSGKAAAPIAIAGDLLGIDASGQAVAVHAVNGVAMVQLYALNDGLFLAG